MISSKAVAHAAGGEPPMPPIAGLTDPEHIRKMVIGTPESGDFRNDRPLLMILRTSAQLSLFAPKTDMSFHRELHRQLNSSVSGGFQILSQKYVAAITNAYALNMCSNGDDAIQKKLKTTLTNLPGRGKREPLTSPDMCVDLQGLYHLGRDLYDEVFGTIVKNQEEDRVNSVVHETDYTDNKHRVYQALLNGMMNVPDLHMPLKQIFCMPADSPLIDVRPPQLARSVETCLPAGDYSFLLPAQ
mgnify:CR=1 FL=1